MQPSEFNQSTAVNSRQTLQGTDIDIKELAQTLARNMGCEFPPDHNAPVSETNSESYTFMKAEFRLLAEELLAAAQAREAKLLKTISDEATAIAFYGDQPPQWMLDLIALPTDDSALMDALDREALRVKREFIKDQQYALKQERERICNLYSPDDTASDFMDKIRGLA